MKLEKRKLTLLLKNFLNLMRSNHLTITDFKVYKNENGKYHMTLDFSENQDLSESFFVKNSPVLREKDLNNYLKNLDSDKEENEDKVEVELGGEKVCTVSTNKANIIYDKLVSIVNGLENNKIISTPVHQDETPNENEEQEGSK
jgi:hypothetical protein